MNHTGIQTPTRSCSASGQRMLKLKRCSRSPSTSYYEYIGCERRGLVRYIDAFSRSMGDESKDEFTVYIDEPTDHEKISEAVETITKTFRESHEYYRMAFRSISTLIAYSDPNTAFRFLSPLCGKRKRDKAVSMFTVENPPTRPGNVTPGTAPKTTPLTVNSLHQKGLSAKSIRLSLNLCSACRVTATATA